jgi:hypothetical protein
MGRKAKVPSIASHKDAELKPVHISPRVTGIDAIR